MNALKALNLLVRFLLELGTLAAVAYWSFQTRSDWFTKLLFGIGLPLLIAVTWGLIMSPKAPYRLRGIPFTIMDFVLLGSGAAALYASGQTTLAWIFAAMLIIEEVLRLVWKQ